MSDREMLTWLVGKGNAFRNCPIADDDFPMLRDRFDSALDAAKSHLANRDRPVVVCLCGSTRFMEAFYDANMRETLAGKIVLTVGMSSKGDCKPTDEQKVALDILHKRKIDLSDEILVLNCKRWCCATCGVFADESETLRCDCRGDWKNPPTGVMRPYIGQSTRSEIDYAEQAGKRIRYLEPTAAMDTDDMMTRGRK